MVAKKGEALLPRFTHYYKIIEHSSSLKPMQLEGSMRSGERRAYEPGNTIELHGLCFEVIEVHGIDRKTVLHLKEINE